MPDPKAIVSYIVAGGLTSTALVSTAGLIVMGCMKVEPHSSLVSISATAIGALAAFCATIPHRANGEKPPQAPA